MSHFSPTVNHYYGDNHKFINKIIEEDEAFINLVRKTANERL